MAKQLVCIALTLVLGSLTVGKSAWAQPPAIAHWTFNTPDITTDANGIATVVDVAGSHSGTRINAAAGVLPINSVGGQFGQAAEFTNVPGDDPNGASAFEIPNLTEIMGAAGGDFSVGVWSRVGAGTSGFDNTILSDWHSGTGTHPFWFERDNPNTAPRGQLRFADPGDIVANTVTAAEVTAATGDEDGNLGDDLWHHFAWTWEKSIGTMKFYIDGNLADTVVSAQTGANLDILTSTSVNAHIGWKQDSDDYYSGSMDELWVFDAALSAEEVIELRDTNFGAPVNLSLEIDQTSGQVMLRNTTEAAITLASYRITSAGGGLDVAGWDRVSTGTPIPGFPQGNGSGNGWEAGPNPSANELVEWNLTAESTIGIGQSISLGAAYNDALDLEDIRLQYTLLDNTLKNASIAYVDGPGGLTGDYNQNGVVDAADYTVWRDNLNTAFALPNRDPSSTGNVSQADYNAWKANFGSSGAGAGSSVSGAVPEPSTIALIIFAACALLAAKRRCLQQRMLTATMVGLSARR